MPKSADTRPLPKKRRAEIEGMVGGNLSFTGDLGEQLLRGIDDMLRTGLRKVNQDNEDSPLHCSSEYHFARFTGPGSTLAPLLYAVSFHLAGDTGNFFLSMQKLKKYLNVKEDEGIYAAAYLLVASGFWEKIEEELGKPTKYRPVGHTEWAERHSGFCTKKLELHFSDGDELGRALHGILGGEKYFDGTLQGLRNTGASDANIIVAAKHFMEQDKGNGSGIGRRKRFQAYLREVAPSFKLDGPE